jgi:anaerobic selenocysteine-containing dehydrogenase
VLYRTLGKALPERAASTAFLLPLAMMYAGKHAPAVKRAGYTGNRATLGVSLFRAILKQRSGVVLSRHEYGEVWSLLAHEDQRAHLDVPEMLSALGELAREVPPNTANAEFPFVLLAGERRMYNANAIFRDPAWRKQDKDGALRIHPADADALGLSDGKRARVRSARGVIEVSVKRDESVRRGMVTLPHGHGTRYGDSEPLGPALNQLTSAEHCEPFTRTPFHKHVPVQLEALPG